MQINLTIHDVLSWRLNRLGLGCIIIILSIIIVLDDIFWLLADCLDRDFLEGNADIRIFFFELRHSILLRITLIRND